ncbi:RNA polymerase sigma factor [Rufibacter glacialis]|uniref:RNA polymerase sigma factor n=1 Tax=Rufibacter glacialis TaxID=1259555 RepID=A0A5M8QIJ4_9BACT|nr:sigma-70 family RNA polymerase sigma factor [Rufibacter glacialis]KAA6434780.1 sigma-70 family RNA polymerase sigma factor [Rufibacter glacialis]GGK72359.1 hypothetical protein GCM10011405_20750 [Rufibacter glacialis]
MQAISTNRTRLPNGLQLNVDDNEVWKRFQSGDEGAFATLYENYVQVIYQYGRKYSEDPTLLEDCIHGLFLDLWKRKGNLAQPTSIRFYLYASLKRRIHKEIQNRKEVPCENLGEIARGCGGSHESVENSMILAQAKLEQKASLKKGLLLLPVNQRKAVLLKFYKNLTFQEISGTMELSIDNAYKLVSRGLLGLKKNVKYLNGT